MILTLNETNLREATHWIAERDEAMAVVLDRYGYPPLWARTPGFSTLVHIILEQQVSLASANATFARLQELLGEVGPAQFLQLDDSALREIGYSRQKIAYTRNLAQYIVENSFELAALQHCSDDEARAALKQFKGIGDWTADIYLSECLLRPDILPKGDIAMQEAFKVLKGLPARPVHEDFEKGTEHWRPWRSVGTRMLWHYYLCSRKRT